MDEGARRDLVVRAGGQSALAELQLHPVLTGAGSDIIERALEFFAVTIRNPNTRVAYLRALRPFWDGLEVAGLGLADVRPVHVAAYVEQLTGARAAATVKQHLAAIRNFYGWLVTGGLLERNPAADVRGPSVRGVSGKTPVLFAEDCRRLLDSIDTSQVVGLRDKALISVMLYGFARVSAAVAMRRKDYQCMGSSAWFVLHEKGGRFNRVPVHHSAGEAMWFYLEGANLVEAPSTSPLFRAADGKRRALTARALTRQRALEMVKRRARNAGFDPTLVRNHTFRASGITAYMEGGGDLTIAAQIAGHASVRSTQLYDRSRERISRGEIERIRI